MPDLMRDYARHREEKALNRVIGSSPLSQQIGKCYITWPLLHLLHSTVEKSSSKDIPLSIVSLDLSFLYFTMSLGV